MKVVIVGGVAGGASLAARLRRLDEQAEIIMFERGSYISFANCGLPYYIGGIITDRDELLLQTPESFNERFDVDVRIESEVIGIDRAKKTVKVLSGSKTYDESYDILALSPGSRPIIPNIKGADSDKVMPLWTIPDMDKIAAATKGAKSAVIVGGGFIGVEMAENLVHAGLEVTLIDMMDQVMSNLDFDMAQILHKHMSDKGVKLALSQSVKGFEETDAGITVTTDKASYSADFAILSIGVRPNIELARDCGLTIGEQGGIVVDESLKTSDENIYAIGDAVEVVNFVSGEKGMMPLAGPANKMGRMAADNICGMGRTYKGTQGSSVAKVFDFCAASTGMSEKQLQNLNKKVNEDYKVTVLHPLNHAGYYPGGQKMCLKVIFDTQGKVLGAQAVGGEGVDKRIDVIATAIRFGATADDLQELELCYAPPYSSGKDPVNMAGFAAENIFDSVESSITFGELAGLPSDTVFLDVRTPGEVSRGAIKGSVNIPVDELRERIDELDREKSTVVYCAVGIRAHTASRILISNGFENVRNLSGGYATYGVASKDYTAG